MLRASWESQYRILRRPTVGDKLLKVDAAVTVRVCLGEGLVDELLGVTTGGRKALPHQTGKLVSVEHAVAVPVEQAEESLRFLLPHLPLLGSLVSRF